MHACMCVCVYVDMYACMTTETCIYCMHACMKTNDRATLPKQNLDRSLARFFPLAGDQAATTGT